MPADAGQRRRIALRDPGGIVAGLLFLALGVHMVLESGGMTPLGAVFPRTIGIAMAVLSVGLLLRCVWPRRQAADDSGATDRPLAVRPTMWRRVALVVILLLWAWLMTRLGFFVTAGAMMLALVLIANHDRLSGRRLAIYAAVILVITAGAYLLFVELLLVPTPRGVLI